MRQRFIPNSNATLKVNSLSYNEQRTLACELIQEQIINARQRLHRWRDLTDQPAQVDTGYVAQHLVSIVAGIQGNRMRGKGDDLLDGSEIKSANFLDARDKRGRVAPRWNFSSNDEVTMLGYLQVPFIYLVSIDWNSDGRVRTRVWVLDPDRHEVFRKRYLEWVEKKGLPKLGDPDRPVANFQMFPPKSGRDENYARHGSNRRDELPPIKIMLDDPPGSRLIFHAEEDSDGKVQVLVFAPLAKSND